MSSLSAKMISSFVAKYSSNNSVGLEEAKKAAAIISDKVPFTFDQVTRLSESNNEDIYQAAVSKAAQRYQDAEDTLYEAVDNGIESESDLRAWLGVDDSASVQEVIDKMHVYQTIGEKGNPQSASLAA